MSSAIEPVNLKPRGLEDVQAENAAKYAWSGLSGLQDMTPLERVALGLQQEQKEQEQKEQESEALPFSRWKAVGMALNPEPADIHRDAKIRGLNHDQGTIDEKTERPVREQKELNEIGNVLKQEQSNLDTRRAGVRNSMASLYSALTQETDPENRRAIQQRIGQLENEDATIAADMKNVTSLMDSHGVPDHFLRRLERGQAASTKTDDSITDAEREQIDNFVNTIKIDPDTTYNEARTKQLLKDADLGHLAKYAKHISPILADMRTSAVRRQEEKDAAAGRAYENKAKKLAVKKAEGEAEMSEGKKQELIKFLSSNTTFSPENAAKLDALVKDYSAANPPKNIADVLSNLVFSTDENKYNAQITTLKGVFGIKAPPPKPADSPPEKKVGNAVSRRRK